jgi:hypothetical protein
VTGAPSSLAAPAARRRASPYRLTSYVPEEVAIHEAINHAMAILVLPPTQFTTFPAGMIELTGQQAAKLYRMGLKRSWPDILVAYDWIYGMEVKRPGAYLSRPRTVRTRSGAMRHVDGQSQMFPLLLRAGFKGIAVVHSVEEALVALRGWGVPLRGVS